MGYLRQQYPSHKWECIHGVEHMPVGVSDQEGRLRPAPESFLSEELISEISHRGVDKGRRDLLRGSFAAALAGASGLTFADDPNIVNVPEWSRSLGKPVATDPYGQPSPFEANIIRRQSPGLTQTDQASVAFTPSAKSFWMHHPQRSSF